jgi:hypothetical protein
MRAAREQFADYSSAKLARWWPSVKASRIEAG